MALAPVPSAPAPEGAVPPQNLEAEESVLGAMMLAPTAIAAVSEVLDAGDFYRESHARIYRAALALYGKNEPVDAITLTNELEQRGELEAVGGRVRLHELARLVPATANARHYAEIVRETATLRGLIRAGGEIAQLGWEREGEPGELVSRAEQLVFELGERRAKGELTLFKDTLHETFERIEHLYQSGAEVTGLPTGFKDLDRITAGFQPANLIILAARPSMGKSAFALEIASHVAVDGKVPTAFFSLEMSRQEVAQRMMCSRGKVDSHAIRTGRLTRDDWPRLMKACSDLEGASLYVDDTPALSLLELRARAQTLKRRHPDLGLVVVDYLQLMTTGRSEESRLQEVSAISRGLKGIAKDLDIPVVALSQLSRAVEQRHDKRPMLSDLRESGSIEQDADLVMFLYREEYYERDEVDDTKKGRAEVIVAKHRNGPVDSFEVEFISRYAKFAGVKH
ncbi:MAG TPA: replicative DNA helicase [Gaiellaceae bacterium]|nr:replicative DNA helicase [Gaiellaceae bacterium]